MTAQFLQVLSQCGYCNGYHFGKCPMVKSFEYHQNGTLKRVEFFEQEKVELAKIT